MMIDYCPMVGHGYLLETKHAGFNWLGCLLSKCMPGAVAYSTQQETVSAEVSLAECGAHSGVLQEHPLLHRWVMKLVIHPWWVI